jgi:hypothetical protein
MIRDKKIGTEKEISELYSMLKNEIGRELNERTRDRPVVYARVVFSKILLDIGHHPEGIASWIGVKRSNIYHYRSKFSKYYVESKMMNNLYNKYYKAFNSDEAPAESSSLNTKEILEIENKAFFAQIVSLKNKVEEKEAQLVALHGKNYKRFSDIFMIISRDVKKGRETLFSRKVRNLINTTNESEEPKVFE